MKHLNSTKSTLVLLFFSISSFFVKAQTSSSSGEKLPFQIFFEKVYLHTDRNVYASGEDIWFKAYVINAQNNYLLKNSNNLYVELISPESKIIDRKVIRVDGVGIGDFQLSDSIPKGKYYIRAYTNWMRNFRNCFVFEKEIDIHSSSSNLLKTNLTAPDQPKYDLQFFPEGGELVNGVTSVIGFKAIDEFGNGYDVKGHIINSAGDTITYFESTHLGMGKLFLLPVSNTKYYATGMVNNKFPFKKELPAISEKGFVMQILNSNAGDIKISISTNHETFNEFKDKEMILIGKSLGKTCISAGIKIANIQTTLKVPKSAFPGGVAVIKLCSNDLKPYAERVVFIDKNEKVQVSISADKTTYKPREAVNLKVLAKDNLGNPVRGNFSLAVTDAGMVPEEQADIFSYFMLESEIKGKIEKPAMYFDTTNTNRFKQLDLLLLTQGWRNYVWKQLTDSAIKIKYMFEPGIAIMGKLRQKFADKPIPGVYITLFLSGPKKGALMSTKTDSLGKFYFEGLEFYGSNKLKINARNEKGKTKGWLFKDTTFTGPMVVPYKPGYIAEQTSALKLFGEKADEQKNSMKKYKLSDTIALNEVIIQARTKMEEDQLRNHASEGGFADFNFKISPEDYTYGSISAFLIAKLPGAQVSNNIEQTSLIPDKIAIRSMGEEVSPRFLVDNFRVDSMDEQIVYNLTMEQIDRIIISRSDAVSGVMNRYVISVFTKTGAFERKDMGSVSEMVSGYYEAREFYSPTYVRPRTEGERPDLRTTIYWNPKVETNENGEATVKFYNADKPTTIKAQIEGVSDKGLSAVGKTKYTVK